MFEYSYSSKIIHHNPSQTIELYQIVMVKLIVFKYLILKTHWLHTVSAIESYPIVTWT